jgi:hypothetical protein
MLTWETMNSNWVPIGLVYCKTVWYLSLGAMLKARHILWTFLTVLESITIIGLPIVFVAHCFRSDSVYLPSQRSIDEAA